MELKRTVKVIGSAAAAVFISLVAAIAAGAAGFGFSFLIFGDGSELYFRLRNMLPFEPYIILPAVLFTTVMIGALTAAALLIKKIRR